MILISKKGKHISSRLYANVLDYTLVLIFTFFYTTAVGDEITEGTFKVTGWYTFALPLFWLFYFPVCETIFKQTLGKKFFDLYVVDFRGYSPGLIHAFLRRCLDLLEIFLLGIPSIVSIYNSDRNQRLGDRLAGTTVVALNIKCEHCKTNLELSIKEALVQTFVCPHCNKKNCVI